VAKLDFLRLYQYVSFQIRRIYQRYGRLFHIYGGRGQHFSPISEQNAKICYTTKIKKISAFFGNNISAAIEGSIPKRGGWYGTDERRCSP
jgi:hypothetical protein